MVVSSVNTPSVLITGAGSGIGRATALAFGGQATQIALCDIDPAALQQTADLLKPTGAEVLKLVGDIASEDQVEHMIARALGQLGALDAAVNCAGIEGPDHRLAELPAADFARVLAVNLTGTFLCMRAEIASMRERGRGSIVNIASIAGKVGLRGKAAYAASKHGVIGLTKTAALEYARAGIRVNAICPGAIDTPLLERGLGGSPEARQELANSLPAGRIASATEVAAAAVWLCSDGASYVTGHTLVVDGGFLAQ